MIIFEVKTVCCINNSSTYHLFSFRDVIHLPMRGPSPTTALTPTSHFGGRALLSVPNSGQQDRSLSSPAHRNSKRALIPGSVSTALSNLNHYLEKKIQATTVERKPHQNSSTGVNSSLVSSMCSCPAPDVANVTTMKRYAFIGETRQ